MRLLVSGGRDFDDVEFIVTHLTRLSAVRDISCLIHGAASGVDTIAAMWADEVGIPHIPVKAEWRDDNGKLDKSEGLRRNQLMIDQHYPDALFAFPGGRGTANMVERGMKCIREVWVSQRIFFKKEDPESGFMSNFAQGYGFYDDEGIWWDTSEHYYQAMKSVIGREREYVRVAPSPAQAAKRGREEMNTTYDWPERKFAVMRKAIGYKFAEGTEAAGLLQCTGIDYLIEYAPWGDTVWGVDKNHEGLNWLGRILMEQREKLL